MEDRDMRLITRTPLTFAMAVFVVTFYFSTTGSVLAADSASDDKWQYSASLYLWMPGIEGETASGAEIDVDFSTLLDNLNMTFMGMVEARKSKLSLLADIAYLNVGGRKSGSIPIPTPGPGNPSIEVDADVKVKGLIVNLLAGYTVLETETATMDVVGGTRYLNMETEFDANLTAGPIQRPVSESTDDTYWDAVVGIRGRSQLNQNWYLPYHLDVGTGESDLTWQLIAGVGYEFDWGDVAFVYRHMEWEFDDSSALTDINFSGPLLLGTYNF
jgi:hypothetical protein